MPPSREPRFGLLALVTYGVVFAFTGLAIGTYYYMAAQRDTAAASSVSDTRTVQVGAIWVPAYPGAALNPPTVVTQGDLIDGTMEFATSDPAAQAVAYFQTTLAKMGYQVSATENNAGGGTVQAIRQGGRMRILVTVQTSREGASISLRTLARTETR